MSELTPRQEAFVQQYLIDRNATQAAIRAGYSAKTAEQQGYRLLRNDQVAAAIAAGCEDVAARLGVTAERVVRAMADIAFADPRAVMRWGMREVQIPLDDKGKPLPDHRAHEAVDYITTTEKFLEPLNSDDLELVDAQLVTEVSQGKQGFKIKLADRQKALEGLARHLGLFKDQLEVTVSQDAAQALAAARRRAKERDQS